jgi:hypothetical protein
VADPLKFEVNGQEVEVTDVDSIEVVSVSLGARVSAAKSLRGQVAQSAVVSLFLPPALDMPAQVSAMKTAAITLHFGKFGDLVFDVYNDRLAVNQESKTAYYLSPTVQRLYNSTP